MPLTRLRLSTNLINYQRANLEYEIAHLQRFQRNFSEWDNVHVPTVYPDYCTPALMVMERLVGVKITDGADSGHDMKPIAHECTRSSRWFLKMVFFMEICTLKSLSSRGWANGLLILAWLVA